MSDGVPDRTGPLPICFPNGVRITFRRRRIQALFSGRAAIVEQDAEADPVLTRIARVYDAGLKAGLPVLEAALLSFRDIHTVVRMNRPASVPNQAGKDVAADAAPETDLSRDLRAAAQHPRPPRQTEPTPDDPVSGVLLRSLMALEAHAGVPPEKARRIALGIMGERNQAVRQAEAFLVPTVDEAEILRRIADVRDRLAA